MHAELKRAHRPPLDSIETDSMHPPNSDEYEREMPTSTTKAVANKPITRTGSVTARLVGVRQVSALSGLYWPQDIAFELQ